MESIRVKKRLSRITYSTTIYNSTIIFEDDKDSNICLFIKKDYNNSEFQLS